MPAHNGDEKRENWHLNTAFYFATFIEFITMACTAQSQLITDAAGMVWNTRALYESMGLVAIFTMGFVCCLAYIHVQKSHDLV